MSDAPTVSGGFSGAAPHGRNPAFAKAFVDFQNDVTAKDVKLATREGFVSIEHVKRYTTTGMGRPTRARRRTSMPSLSSPTPSPSPSRRSA